MRQLYGLHGLGGREAMHRDFASLCSTVTDQVSATLSLQYALSVICLS